jgi:hypothetical protein
MGRNRTSPLRKSKTDAGGNRVDRDQDEAVGGSWIGAAFELPEAAGPGRNGGAPPGLGPNFFVPASSEGT